MNRFGYSKSIGLLIGVSLAALLLLATVGLWYQYKDDTGTIIAQDIEQLGTIFDRIDREAGILGFDYEKNPINFLTIKHGGFVSSEVGSLNLIHPDRWQGPYLARNPTIQDKEYEIVKNYNGYYILPGTDVTLPDGKQIGLTLKITYQTDIDALTGNGKPLNFEGKPLARKITIGAHH